MKKEILTAAILSSLMMGANAMADDHGDKKDGEKAKAEKNHCKGEKADSKDHCKGSCEGKDGCGDKKKKGESKEGCGGANGCG